MKLPLPFPGSVARVAAACLAAWPASALPFPEGAPWDAAGGDGCRQCHFDAPVTERSGALAVDGLPERFEPGGAYRLTVRLTGEDMATAGFLLSARGEGEDGDGGRFRTVDARAQADGSQARSTEAGSDVPDDAAVAEWTLQWHAPQRLHGPVVLELWANAGNGDQSPFGDATHRRRWRLAAAAGDEPEQR